MSETEAIQKLEDLGLVVADENKEWASADVDEGKVAKTDPTSGRRAKVGTVVTLYISTGEQSYTVASLVGEDANNVKYNLEKNMV